VTFPTTRLGLQVEAAAGLITPGTNPMTWPWTDLSSRLLAQGITFSRGQENESQGLQPATATFELDSLDGALVPSNPASAYWPYFRRGTPVRITAEGATKAAWLPGGVGNYWSSPHRSADNISGDIDIRIYLDPDRWADPPGSWHQHYCGIWGTTTGSFQWRLDQFQHGTVAFDWSLDGTEGNRDVLWFNYGIQSLRPTWVGFTLDVNNGAGRKVGTCYRWDDDSPPADITQWTVVETLSRLGTTQLGTGSTSDLIIGADFDNRYAMRGRFHRLQIRNGINGTLVANPDFTAQTIGATSFADSTGRTWNAHGTAEISTRHTRFAGTIDSIVIDWPYGDHNATVDTAHPSECRAIVTVSDVVRRLGQGSQPTDSTFRRFLVRQPDGFPMLAYWPCEDSQGATRLASGLPGGFGMQVYGVQAGQDASLVSSAPLPVMPADGSSGWAGEVPANSWDTAWEVDLVFRGETGPTESTQCRILEARCKGTVITWRVTVSATQFHLRAWDSGGTLVVTSDQGYPASLWGPWVLCRFALAQSGGNIAWEVDFNNLAEGTGVVYSGTVAGTLGIPQLVANALQPGEAPNGLSFGHVTVAPGVFNNGWLARTDTAWVGETAAHRIWRLASEEGLVAEIVGDPTIGLDIDRRGNTTWSQPLGYQHRDTAVNLLDQAAAVDRGILATRATHPGFVYRTRGTLDNQPVRMVLDAATNAVTVPLQPTLDDQRLRNDVTVSATDGASARALDQASADAEGLYQEDVTVNGVGGVFIQDAILGVQPGLDLAVAYQNHHLAGDLLALGVQTDLRYPRILVDFALAPQLLDDWCALRLGDRIQLVGLPNQHPAWPVELIVEYLGDQVSPTSWVGVLTGGPGAPYLVGVLDT